MQKILLVEDDARLAALVQSFLQQQGFEVRLESRGDTVAAICQSWLPSPRFLLFRLF